ncbi:glycosyltransferase family 4 protein [Clostridium sp. B9]|uniref:glycosyltransferase family 4 protein n=1 Tax=Clostridium sp. B9 TaxID=3423224 RepID=UPI003D2EFD83
MTKVLLINLGREYGGAEKVIENLFFSNYENCRMYLVALDNTKFADIIKANENGNRVVLIPNDKKKIIKSLLKIRKYILDNNINIIHAHGVTSEVFGVLLSLITKRKVITTIHSRADFDTTNKLKGNIYCFLQKYLINLNKKYIVVSNELEKFFVEDLKVNDEKLIFINNGLRELNNRERVKHEEFTICSIGRLTAVKAHNKLIEAMTEINDEKINLECLIAGNGELESSLKTQVVNSSLEDRIKFLGFIEDVRDVFDKSDCLIIQSDMEGLPMTLLEAMSYKIPIIAYRVGGIKKLLSSNECIELKSNKPSDIACGIREAFYKSRDELSCIANNAFVKFKKNYDIEIFIKKHEALYRSIEGDI